MVDKVSEVLIALQMQMENNEFKQLQLFDDGTLYYASYETTQEELD